MAAMPLRSHWSLRKHLWGEPDEVFWTASDIGWAVDIPQTVYAPLLLVCTTVMYEGSRSCTAGWPGAFWRVNRRAGVRVFFHISLTAPTPFRAVHARPRRSHDPCAAISVTSAPLFLSGERCR